MVLIAASTQAQILFVAGGNNIVEVTPGGSPSVFVSGLNGAGALAFDGAGNLFATDGNGNINEITPEVAEKVTAFLEQVSR